ncbi:unnamed protein product [Mucor hiemalis]
MVWPFRNSKVNDQENLNSNKELLRQETNETGFETIIENKEEDEDEGYQNKYKYAPKKQDEEQPMDLGTLQDMFSFGFLKGRPIFNFFIAIIWSIGLPILLYNILKPHIGQVLAMIVASAPPLAIVIVRMIKDRSFDPLGCVAGISFLISGILSIAEPEEKTQAICESIVPFLVGVFCVISVLPIKIGSFELKPFVFQMANQIMPRNDSEELQKQDDSRLTSSSSGQKRLDYLYQNMSKFRHDMRIMTVCWGLLLIVTFIVKVIIVMTATDISKLQLYGFLLFGVASVFMFTFTWIYTNIVKGHVFSQVAFWKEQKEEQKMDKSTETVQNVNWGVNSASNVFSQVVG